MKILYNIGVYCSDILLEELKPNAIMHKNLNIPVKENKITIVTCLIRKIKNYGAAHPLTELFSFHFMEVKKIFN